VGGVGLDIEHPDAVDRTHGRRNRLDRREIAPFADVRYAFDNRHAQALYHPCDRGRKCYTPFDLQA